MAKKIVKAKAPARLKREDTKLPPEAVGADKDTEEVTPKLRSKQAEKEEEEEKSDTPEDYLLQYQYKKVNNNPVLGSVAGALTNPDKGSKAEKMKAILLSQKKVTMLIPLPEGSDPKVLFSVTLNGYRLDFPTNTYIEVPQQVAEVVSKSNSQTLLALSRDRIDGNSKKEDALS